MMKIEGSASGSGSISQRHGSADPDPHQNVMDPQHWSYFYISDSRYQYSIFQFATYAVGAYFLSRQQPRIRICSFLNLLPGIILHLLNE
jgi:hypothetical protein